MIFHPTSIEGAWLIQPEVKTDERGSFHRVWDMDELKRIGHHEAIVQHNHSTNLLKGTVRGLHYQHPPVMEIKIVKCIRGAIWDVIVDIRKGSPTFLKSFSAELSDTNFTMMYIPKGCAHGFQTLTDNAEVLYYHTEFYAPANEGGLRHDDPVLEIQWPVTTTSISDRDKSFPLLTKEFAGF